MLLSQNLKYLASQANQANFKNSLAFRVTDFLMGTTIQFLWHLQLQEATNFDKQREVSIEMLSTMLRLHKNCPDLLQRILPIALRKKIKESNGPNSWVNFFKANFSKAYVMNSSREQWNEEMRRELT